jgi:hypothetical protein
MTDQRLEQFAVAHACRIEVRLGSGGIDVVEGPADQITVEVRGPEASHFRIEQLGDRIVIQPETSMAGFLRSHEVRLAVPSGTTTLQAHVASASVRAGVDLRALSVAAASGDITLRSVTGSVDVKLASGDLEARRIGGSLDVVSASGSVVVERVDGDANVTAASGNVRLRRTSGELRVKTVSGDVLLGHIDGPAVSCKTVSGDVRISIPSGRELDVDLETFTGSIRNAFDVKSARPDAPGGTTYRIHVRSMSGDIILQRSDESAAVA